MKLVIENENDEMEISEVDRDDECRFEINCVGMWIKKEDAQRIINHLKIEYNL